MQILHCVDRYRANRIGDANTLKPPRTGFRLGCGDYRVFFDLKDENTVEITGTGPTTAISSEEPAEVLPKSAADQAAVSYTLKNWKALPCYAQDGDLEVDNNRTERSLRGIAVGRKNWLFSGSDNGGRTAAVLRSFVSSCELAKVDPFAWFRDVLSRIADHPITKLAQLLPHCWAAAQA
ncbi:MAG: transposase [Bryobacterales bacterium]|nr:transposase [Bryobacterales bacterium]MBV9399755.1 transposase [Bryobacterales bacterium]